MSKIKGIYAASMSILNDDLALDIKKTVHHAEMLIEQGCHGVAIFGSTGQAQLISISEKIDLLNHLALNKYKEKYMIGTGLNSLGETINLMKVAKSLNFEKFLIMPPAYYKYKDQEVINFYSKIVEAIPESEIILYNFEKLCGYKFSVECVEELVKKFPQQIIGVKDSSYNLFENLKLDNFSVLPGSESKLLKGLQLGCSGIITATCNVTSKLARKVYDDFQLGAEQTVNQKLCDVRAVFEKYNLISGLHTYYLKRDNKKSERHDGINGFFKLAKDLNQYNFEKVFIFNSSLRFNLISRLAGINKIYQYPLFEKKNQHITEPAKNLLKKYLSIEVSGNPEIQIENNLVKQTFLKFNLNNDDLNILLGIGGSGSTKRIPSKTYLNIMEKIDNKKKCKFFLATGKDEDEQKILNEIYNSKFKDKCIRLDNLTIAETLPIIKNCNVSICNDTGFAHLSSALGIKTITLMADTPLIYGSYSSIMYPIIPDGEITVTHNTLGKDKIDPDKVFNKLISIMN